MLFLSVNLFITLCTNTGKEITGLKSQYPVQFNSNKLSNK